MADAVAHGYLQRAAAVSDARRAVLTVTQAGQDLITSAHAWQEEVFARLTADWEADDAIRVAGYLHRPDGRACFPDRTASGHVVRRLTELGTHHGLVGRCGGSTDDGTSLSAAGP